MPKKKQGPLQNNIPGKFIPRDDPPPTPVNRSGPNVNRFNSRMAELLASTSSTIATNENEPIPNTTKSPPEITTVESSRSHTNLFQRRIVTMLETFRRRGGNNGATSPTRSIPPNSQTNTQPITFGQLRQAGPPPPPAAVIEDSQSHPVSVIVETNAELPAATPVSKPKSSLKHQKNRGRLHYSPSLEKLLEQQSAVPRMRDEEEEEQQQQQQQKPSLTVDEILARYYSKVEVPTIPDTQSSIYGKSNPSFYIHPTSSPQWNTPQRSSHLVPAAGFPSNEQNRSRPPPPSYSASIASGHRPPPSLANTLAQHLIRPPAPSSIQEQTYSSSHRSPYLSSSTALLPPPRYELPTAHTNTSSVNLPQAGFDREFSFLLYGKDVGGGKNQKRKALSDPDRKSVEEAAHRSTMFSNGTVTVTEEEETNSDSNDVHPHERTVPHQRQTNVPKTTRESARQAIVPPNPLLYQRIPSFLSVYSQAASSTDPLLRWHLFSLSELESIDAMMTKLYKDENLYRVKLYEDYRALLNATLAWKTSSNRVYVRNDEEELITTTAL